MRWVLLLIVVCLATAGCGMRATLRDGFAVPSAVVRYVENRREWPTRADQLRGLSAGGGGDEPFDPGRYHIALYPQPDGRLEVALAARREHPRPAAACGRLLMEKTADGFSILPLQPISSD